MGVGTGLYMYDVVETKFTFAISSPDEFLYKPSKHLGPAVTLVILYLTEKTARCSGWNKTDAAGKIHWQCYHHQQDATTSFNKISQTLFNLYQQFIREKLI